MEVHDGVLDAHYPKRARKIEFVDDSCRYARRALIADCPIEAGKEEAMEVAGRVKSRWRLGDTDYDDS